METNRHDRLSLATGILAEILVFVFSVSSGKYRDDT